MAVQALEHAVQHPHHLGRGPILSNRRKVGDVGKQHAHVVLVGQHLLFLPRRELHDLVNDVRRIVAGQAVAHGPLASHVAAERDLRNAGGDHQAQHGQDLQIAASQGVGFPLRVNIDHARNLALMIQRHADGRADAHLLNGGRAG